MNSVRPKWVGTIAKFHFVSREAQPLGAIFWTYELYFSLF